MEDKSENAPIFTVEEILQKRMHKKQVSLKKFKMFMLIDSFFLFVEIAGILKWEGYGHESNTWEPKTNFSPDLIKIFEAKEAAKKRARKSQLESGEKPHSKSTLKTGKNQND